MHNVGHDGYDHPSTPVLLLKTRSSPSDGYEDYFREATDEPYDPFFLAVFRHRLFDNALDWLRNLILDQCFLATRTCSGNEDDAFGGIIFTSQKAVEAFSQVINPLSPSDRDALLPDTLPLYVVGSATAKALRALELRCAVLGEHTGSGDVLADLILNDYGHRVGDSRVRRLLFLVGEQRRDIIPKKLQSESLAPEDRLQVVEKVVYEIAEQEAFAGELATALSRFHAAQSIWIVVFSPTGCKAMLQTLGWLDSHGQFDGRRRQKRIRIATIGPTTFEYLKEHFGFEAQVCAHKPSPAGVGEGIARYTEANSSIVD